MTTWSRIEAAGGQQRRDRRRHRARGEEHHHPGQDPDRLLGPEAEGHDLTPHLVGFVDHQDVVVVREVRGQGFPAAPHQHGIAGGQDDLSGSQALAAPLHGHDDEVAALGDHPREDRLTDESGAGRDDELGGSVVPAEERVVVVQVVVGGEHLGEGAEVRRHATWRCDAGGPARRSAR